MIDEASAEDIRIAKQHLERALARAINRDSLRWTNPPTYVVTEEVPQGEYYAVNPEAFVDLDEPDVLEWQSLDHVPVGVVVRDKAGDFWKIKPDGRLRIRFHDKKKWEKVNDPRLPLSAWDSYAPFTEVKDR